MSNWYFFYQPKGGEDDWLMALSPDRDRIINTVRPAFSTVLDVSAIPEDNDWSKVRYRGPLYFDFDAGDDLPLVCEKFKDFLAKLHARYDFDISQARLYASGGKGFHVEIPEECFMPKVPQGGTAWLPYIYREMAQDVIVDTLDLQVYSGKRGRMWRTAGIKRSNGNYKVPLTLDEALAMSEELYAEVVKDARPEIIPSPPVCNSRMAMLFERAKSKMTDLMRTKKKRQQAASVILDPWKRAGRTPPSIQRLMDGQDIADGAGFQQLSMQLAIYATSVGLELQTYLDMCKGLCENHVSDSYRYNTEKKRRDELARMYRYMEENTLYEFDPGPIAKLTRPGVSITDLGVVSDTEVGSPSAAPEQDAEGNPTVDLHKGMRKGIVMGPDGIFRRTQDGSESICRAALSKIESFYDLEHKKFHGYEFDISVRGALLQRTMLSAEAFTSAANMRKFFSAYQLAYQGGDPETIALLDVMSERASRTDKVYTYPREGLFIIDNPEVSHPEPVVVYLTQDAYLSSVPPDSENSFALRYRPTQALSSYCIDIHKAPTLGPEHEAAVHDLLSFTREDILADLLGWFVACHYRSAYLRICKQFPLLQLYGEAGAGKTQTVLLLSRLHWYMGEVSVKSATACTRFAMDAHVSSSTSAPFILDEYKPRELRQHRGQYEKVKDVLKASYVGGDVGERGTVNKGAENQLAVIKSKATAPIVFMGEAIEMETAIFERCVSVNLSKSYQTRHRQAAFQRLQANPEALSAIGRQIVELGFRLDLDAMAREMTQIREQVEARLPDHDNDSERREAARLVFNRTVVVHGLLTLKRVLARAFGDKFNSTLDTLMGAKVEGPQGDERKIMQMHGMSELSKVVSRIAMMSREVDKPYEMKLGQDYLIGDGWVEIRVERSYDQYRRFCVSINDTPLFDNIDAYCQAFNAYSPCVDRVCANSEIRPEGSSERVVRLDTRRLAREGVMTFRQ